MKQWTNEQAKRLRHKRSDLRLTKKALCRELKIGFHTLTNLEVGAYKVKQTIYIKVLEWLAEDY